MLSLLPALLIGHLIGLSLMVGTTVIESVNYRFFWTQLAERKPQATSILDSIARCAKFVGLGALLLILTGLGMLFLTHGTFSSQLWFRIKMVLVLLLIGNGVFNGNKISAKIRATVELQGVDSLPQLAILKRKLNVFYLLQLTVVFFIIFLAAYKFN